MTSDEAYGADVARVYDLLVHGRPDVEADPIEVEFLESALGRVCPRDVKDVLDAGCGTGRHLVPLAERGYRMTGLDRSDGMVAECRRKLDRRGLQAELRAESMESLDAEQAFDAILCMDSALCYLTATTDIVRALVRFRRALRPGGLLVVDNLNFLAQWPRYGTPDGDVRESEGMRIEYEDLHWFDDFTSLYHIELHATVHEDGRTWQVDNEDVLRVMTVGEMRVYLQEAGFTGVTAYPSFDRALWGESCGERMIFLALRPEG